jgi:hypothetical protein
MRVDNQAAACKRMRAGAPWRRLSQEEPCALSCVGGRINYGDECIPRARRRTVETLQPR